LAKPLARGLLLLLKSGGAMLLAQTLSEKLVSFFALFNSAEQSFAFGV
jgi:hypothetical protein